MIKNISNLGKILSKTEQKVIRGGGRGSAVCNLPPGESGTSGCSFPASNFDEAKSNAAICCGSNGVKSVWCFGCAGIE